LSFKVNAFILCRVSWEKLPIQISFEITHLAEIRFFNYIHRDNDLHLFCFLVELNCRVKKIKHFIFVIFETIEGSHFIEFNFLIMLIFQHFYFHLPHDFRFWVERWMCGFYNDVCFFIFLFLCLSSPFRTLKVLGFSSTVTFLIGKWI